MEKKRFRVRLVRPVFEYADVEVEAGEEFGNMGNVPNLPQK